MDDALSKCARSLCSNQGNVDIRYHGYVAKVCHLYSSGFQPLLIRKNTSRKHAQKVKYIHVSLHGRSAHK